MNYLTVPLDSTFNRKLFSCGKPVLDDYLYKQVYQDIKKRLSAAFVYPDSVRPEVIKGYYTLSNNSISKAIVPEKFSNKFPNYTIPTTLLGRLAIDHKFKGKGLGALLLLDALKRSYDLSKMIGSCAVIVDPLDKEAESFYLKYGFIWLPDGKQLFLSMAEIQQLIAMFIKF